MGFIAISFLASCSGRSATDTLCQRGVGLENEFAQVGQAMDELGIVTPAQLENTLQVVRASVSSLIDLGPKSLKADFVEIGDVYDLLFKSLEDVGFNGSIAVSDESVASAFAQVSQDRFVTAHENFLSFVAKNCGIEVQPGSNELNGPNTTLPNPVLATDNAPDLITGFDSEDSVNISYGYYVAQQYGLAITNEQALCLGLLMTENAISNLSQSDGAYTALVNDSLKACAIDAIVSN